MAKKTITICTCDICKRENAKNYKTIAYRTFDDTDGKSLYNPPIIESISIDLCDECARRAAVIHSVGVCCESYVFD